MADVVAVWAFAAGVVVLAATPAVIVAAGLFTVGLVCIRGRTRRA